MNLPHIEYCLDQGMDLIISKGPRGDYIAAVRTPRFEHFAPSKSIPGALEALEHLLSKVGPKP